jgi:hypothetical protein
MTKVLHPWHDTFNMANTASIPSLMVWYADSSNIMLKMYCGGISCDLIVGSLSMIPSHTILIKRSLSVVP